jgi:PAS domain S-box-containing protein
MSASDGPTANIIARIRHIGRRRPWLAIRFFHQLEQTASSEKNTALQIDLLLERYSIQERLGETNTLIDELNNASFLADACDLIEHAGKIMVALGRINFGLGQYRDAANFWLRAIDLCGFTKDIESMVEARIGLGQIYDTMGDYESGARFVRDAGVLLKQIDNPYLNAKQTINLAINYLHDGKPQDAAPILIEAQREACRAQADEYYAETLWYLGVIEFDKNNFAEAKTLTEQALIAAKKCGYKWLFGAVNDTLAKIALKQGEVKSAIAIYQDALLSAKEMASLPQIANFYDALSRLYESQNDYQSALNFSRLHQDTAKQLNQLSSGDGFHDLRNYDISRKAPPELLLELEANPALDHCGFNEALRIIASKALEILRVEYICIWLRDEHSNHLICHTIHGPSPLPFEQGCAMNFDHYETYFQELSNTRNPFVVHDVRLHPAAKDFIEAANRIDLKSILDMPMKKDQGQVGVLSLGQCHRQRNWSREDILYASHIGSLIVHALTTARFIDDQKLLEQKVEERTQEVMEKSKYLEKAYSDLLAKDKALQDHALHNQTILDNLADGVITIDTSGTIRSFNLAAIRIFGYNLNEVIGKNVKMLMPEPDQSQHDSYLQQHHSTGEARVIGVGRELQGRRKNGNVFPMELAITKSYERDEVIYVGITRDITERRRLDKLKSEFISTVSHELRTPLTSIQGSLSLLENGVASKLPEAALKLITLASRNSQRLIILINDLLDIEKLAAGKMALNLSSIDLVTLVKQSIRDNGGYGLKYEVQYVLGEHPEKQLVNADSVRLAQVLANLLSNAAKFSDKANQVDIRILDAEHQVCVEIEDHGQGIPEDFQGEIFNSFAQANNGDTRQQGGTGLGLKISKSLIEAMHGSIGFRTTIGTGTVFWFKLSKAVAD